MVEVAGEADVDHKTGGSEGLGALAVGVVGEAGDNGSIGGRDFAHGAEVIGLVKVVGAAEPEAAWEVAPDHSSCGVLLFGEAVVLPFQVAGRVGRAVAVEFDYATVSTVSEDRVSSLGEYYPKSGHKC